MYGAPMRFPDRTSKADSELSQDRKSFNYYRRSLSSKSLASLFSLSKKDKPTKSTSTSRTGSIHEALITSPASSRRTSAVYAKQKMPPRPHRYSWGYHFREVDE